MTPGILTFNISEKLKRFVVTNTSIQAMDNQIFLMIDFQRLSGPFWISLFMPSLLLILAAEITLFIDGKHFKATIAVALTTTLTMYPLYSSFQAKLPEDARLKLVDIWLLHGLLMPMIVFIVLAANELIMSKTKTGRNIMSGTKVANSAVVTSASKENSSSLTRMQTCMTICKALIPITSVLFMTTFFVICVMKNQ